MIEFEKLKEKMERVNAVMQPSKPYRIENLDKTKKEITALCNLIDAFDGLKQANDCGRTISTAEYAMIKERIYNALIEVEEILCPPTIDDINRLSKAFYRSEP